MIVERIENKLNTWKGKYLSVDVSLVLINSILISFLMSMLSFFEIPNGVLEKMEYLYLSSGAYDAPTERPRRVRHTKY
jgi:hypothetical protein